MRQTDELERDCAELDNCKTSIIAELSQHFDLIADAELSVGHLKREICNVRKDKDKLSLQVMQSIKVR